MSATDVLGVLAAAFGVGMGASPLLQARRAHVRRSADDVSIAFLAVLLCGGVAWLSYGVALGNAALVVANSVGICGSGLAIAVALRWRREDAGLPAAPVAPAATPAPPPAGS